VLLVWCINFARTLSHMNIAHTNDRILDLFHTTFVSMSLWDHLIEFFGDASRTDYIPWSLALSIAVTAILTFLVHGFYVHRIYKLTTAKMITLKSLALFREDYAWSFTLGLALSSIMDLLVTGFLCWFLLAGRKKNGNASMHHLLDTLMLYAFENGSLTSTATIVSMICWITMMRKNLIFMALHFVISKLYANSLLATLNTRSILKNGYHTRSTSSAGVNVYGNPARHLSQRLSNWKELPGHVQIKVEEMTLRTIDYAESLPATPKSAEHMETRRDSDVRDSSSDTV
ncbi:hypothetical protein H0H93_015112, partial [Arthromyces matolae]